MRKPNLKDFKDATALCKSFDTNIYFGYSGDGSEVDVHTRDINIDLEEIPNMDWFWSLVFHELGHIWCLDNNKYYIYHADSLKAKEMGKYIRKYGLRIERYVDKIGIKLAKEAGIKFKYKRSYMTQKDILWYKDWVDRNY